MAGLAQDAVIKAFRPAQHSGLNDTSRPNGFHSADPTPLSSPAHHMPNGAPNGDTVANGGAHSTQPRLLPPPLLPAAAAAAPGQAAPDARSSAAEGHCAGVHALALCAGHLCSAGSDATIRVWDPATLALRRCVRA